MNKIKNKYIKKIGPDDIKSPEQSGVTIRMWNGTFVLSRRRHQSCRFNLSKPV